MNEPDGADPSDARSRDDGIKSLSKAARLLDSFSTRDRSMSFTDLCAVTGYPKSTVHRLLGALREVGFIEQTSDRNRYRLGIKLLELGNTVLANMELHREARPFIDSLMRLGGQAVHLAVFDGRRAIVIHRADALPEKSFASHIIEQAPVHCTSVGKAILAFQPPQVIEKVIKAGLTRFTDSTITDEQSLRAALTEVQERGYSRDEGEHQPGLRCVGAPIRNRNGQVMAGISLTGPSWRFPATEIEVLAKVVIHHADGISAALGYQPA